ncbi:MAG: isochorismatase family protein [Muribaculaceae bacterium]
MKKLLLLIDCQYDFINGSLAVAGAPEAMDALAAYVEQHAGDYHTIAATLDWHPHNHCSFAPNGGIWPVHCVQHTHGAALYDPIAKAAANNVVCFTKGDDVQREEYSVFANEASGNRLAQMIAREGYTQIDVCGLCGDYCVLESIKGLCEKGFGSLVNVLLPYTPSIDGGAKLNEYMQETGCAHQG